MSINYGSAYRAFGKEQGKLREQYRQLGMTDEQIKAMYGELRDGRAHHSGNLSGAGHLPCGRRWTGSVGAAFGRAVRPRHRSGS